MGFNSGFKGLMSDEPESIWEDAFSANILLYSARICMEGLQERTKKKSGNHGVFRAVGRRAITSEVRDQSQTSPRGIC